MRYFSIFFLALVAVAIVLFVWHNHAPVPVRFFEWHYEVPLAILAGGIYVLGMLSGWSLLRALRRSIIHATERRHV